MAKLLIPDYVLRQLVRAVRILAERGEFDRSDIKAANALRTYRKLLAKA